MTSQPTRTTVAGRVFNDLRNLARRQGRGTDELLVFYVLERWLYRASISPYHDQLMLKGGLLLAALEARRPTRDADLRAEFDRDEATVVARVCEIAQITVDDGVIYEVDQVKAFSIREDDHSAGDRRCRGQVLGTEPAVLDAAVQKRVEVTVTGR